MSTLANLRARGFDRSEHVPFTKTFRVRCSACAAVTVNNVALHETGCPNEKFECRGCNALVDRKGAYCADCVGEGM